MNLTVKILEEIRDEIRQTNSRLDQTNSRLEAFQLSSEQRADALERKVTEVEIRLSTSTLEVATSLGQLKDLFTDRLDLRERMERCEQAIEELKQSRGR